MESDGRTDPPPPSPAQALEFGGAGTAAMLPLLRIGQRMPAEDFAREVFKTYNMYHMLYYIISYLCFFSPLLLRIGQRMPAEGFARELFYTYYML